MASRTVLVKIEFDYNFDGTFTDESANVVSFRIDRNLAGVGTPFTGQSGQIPKATIILRNVSNRFNSRITAGALYADIGEGKFYRVPVKISINTNGSYRLIFVGVAKATSEINKTTNPSQIQIDCFGKEEILKNETVSLSTTKSNEWKDGVTESSLFSYLLSAYTTSISSGIFTVYPFVFEENLLNLIWGVCDLSGGYFFGNRSGTLTYKTLQNVLGTSSILTITNTSTIKLNYIELDFYKEYKISGYTHTFKIDHELCNIPYILVPANSTISYDVEFDEYCLAVTGENYTVTSLGGGTYTANISISRTDKILGSTLSITNSHSDLALSVNHFILTGTIFNREKITKTYTSADSFWTDRNNKTKKINTDLLTQRSIEYVGQRLKKSTEKPVARIECNDVITNTDIELMDIITIQDTTLFSSNIKCIVFGISYAFSTQSGLRLNIAGIDLAAIASLYGVSPAGYFVLGTNKLGSTDALRGKMYY